MTTAVKYFRSTMPGAPVLSGQAGAMLAVLDACLVNGFGLKSVDTLVVAGGMATANISTGSPAVAGDVVLVAGAAPAGLNGEKKVISATGITVVYDATGIGNQTATGAVSMKIAPAGWSNTAVAAGTNVKAYKPTDTAALGTLLRVDDTGTNDARVVGYETMSDINTGTGRFPTALQVPGGGWWPKSRDANTVPRAWTLIADSRGFYIHPQHDLSAFPGRGNLSYFGDVLPVSSIDAFHSTLVEVGVTAVNSLNNMFATSLAYASSSAGTTTNAVWATRSYTGLGSAVQCGKTYNHVTASSGGQSGAADRAGAIPYPNGPDQSLLLTATHMFEVATFTLRGDFPGVYASPQAIPDVFSTGDDVGDIASLPDRKVVCLTGYGFNYNSKMFVDVTGPWR